MKSVIIITIMATRRAAEFTPAVVIELGRAYQGERQIQLGINGAAATEQTPLTQASASLGKASPLPKFPSEVPSQ